MSVLFPENNNNNNNNSNFNISSVEIVNQHAER